MAEFTAQEQQQLKAIVAEASQPSAALGVAPSGAAAPPLPGNIKDVFCKNWETVKKVLLFLRNFPGVPKKIKDAIDTIIRIGDGAHRVICG